MQVDRKASVGYAKGRRAQCTNLSPANHSTNPGNWGRKQCPGSWCQDRMLLGKKKGRRFKEQRWVWQSYPRRLQVTSSPASRCGTGISGHHQGDPIPPRRSTQPHPQRSHWPGKMGTNEIINSPLLKNNYLLPPPPHFPPHTHTSTPCPSSSQTLQLREGIRPWHH